MLRRLLQLGTVLVVILLVAAVGLYAYVRTLDLNSYKPVLENAVVEATGRALRIEGDLDAVLSLLPTVRAKGGTLANASWSDEPYMARIGSLEISIDLWPLLSGRLEILRVALADVRVVLEKDARGEGNWNFEPKPREEPESVPLEVHLYRLELDDVSLLYRDAASGQTHEVFVESLRMTEPPLLERLSLKLDALYAEQPVHAELATGPLADLIENRPAPVELTVQSSDSRLDVEGTIARPHDAAGLDLAVSFSTLDIASLGPLAGRDLPATENVEGSLHVTDAEGVFRLREIDVSVGGSDLRGDLIVAMGGERPRVTGSIRSRTIDVTELLGPPDRAGDSKKNADGRLFSAEPLPLEGLRAADLDLEIEIEHLDTHTVDLGSLSTHVVLEEGRLRVDPFAADIAEGSVAVTVRFDAASAPPALSVRSSASGVQLGLLSAALTESGLAESGPSDLELELRAGGGSVRELMASLEGFLVLSVGEGRIRNGILDLLGADLLMELVELITPTMKRTDYAEVECAVVYVELSRGVVRSEKTIALETKKMNVTGTGKIDLRNETLEMAVRPRAENGVNFGASGLAEMVYIGGSLSEPAMSIDLKGVATQAATVTAAFATLGVSLLAQNLLADKDPCKTALEKSGARGAHPRPVPADGVMPATRTKPQDKNPIEEVNGFFGRLFGK